jgi:hypothetical protein
MLTPTDMDRLLHPYKEGDRVRAVMEIVYGTGGIVAEGSEGVVVARSTDTHARPEGWQGVVVVRWSSGLREVTCTVALDPAAEGWQ